MKKSLLFLGVLAVGFANAQQEKVGINTETPTRTLDVNGDLRVRTMETLSDFDGLVVAETKDGETNVVKKAEIKGKALLSNVPLTEAELKLSRTNTEDKTKIVDFVGKNASTRDIILPEVPVAAAAYLKRSSDKTYYEVLKSGYYQVSVSYIVKIESPGDNPFDGSVGLVNVNLTARTNKDDTGTGVVFGRDEINIYKGAKTPRITRPDNTTFNNAVSSKIYRLSPSGSIFVPKGGRIAALVYSRGMASVVDDDSELDRITFAPTNGGSSISVYVNL